VARKHGMTATFMPKPLYQDNGSGMHCHQSIWKDGKPLFAGDGYAGLSKIALYYIGGILKHARALAAFTNPGTKLLQAAGTGYEAPVNLASRAATARRRAASRPTRRARRRSAWRSASRIPPATATSPSPRC